MITIVLHEEFLVSRRKVYLGFAPGIISGYKICKSLGLVTKFLIEVTLLAEMIRLTATDKTNVPILLAIIKIYLAVLLKISLWVMI
jgi:hypothetical protein